MKGESVEELVGMVEDMLADSTRSRSTSRAPWSTSSAPGDRAHTINVSTIPALVWPGRAAASASTENAASSG